MDCRSIRRVEYVHVDCDVEIVCVCELFADLFNDFAWSLFLDLLGCVDCYVGFFGVVEFFFAGGSCANFDYMFGFGLFV